MMAIDQDYFAYDSDEELSKVSKALDDQENFHAAREWVEALVEELYGEAHVPRIEDIVEELAGYYEVKLPKHKSIHLAQI